MDPQEKLEKALEEYLKRQSRESHPEGKTDRGGRWYPSDEERQECCKSIRSPSRAYPWSLMTHCRTLGHVARLHGVDPAALRALHNERREVKREGGSDYYKVVARTEDGALLSVYDGATEYVIGRELVQAARQEHGGGYYVYRTPEEARRAPFPERSELAGEERVLLRVRAAGQYCVYDGGKLAFSRVTPLEVVE